MHDGDEMKPQVGDLRTVTQRFDGEQWVLCLQSMPPRELSDDEITFLWHQSMNLAISNKNLKNNISHATIFARAILNKASEK